MPILTFPDRPTTESHQRFAVGAVAFAIVPWVLYWFYPGVATSLLCAISPFGIVAALGVLFEGETQIDVPAGTVREVTRLFGRHHVWTRESRLSEYCAVAVAKNEFDPPTELYVQLRKPRGDPVTLQTFSRPQREADGRWMPRSVADARRMAPVVADARRMARMVADATGLEVEELGRLS